MTRHPTQPLVRDDHGTVRFKQNAIVRYLLDAGPFSLSDLDVMPFSNEDRVQFAQLIGYNLCGFGELNYVADEQYRDAERLLDTVRPLDEWDSTDGH